MQIKIIAYDIAMTRMPLENTGNTKWGCAEEANINIYAFPV